MSELKLKSGKVIPETVVTSVEATLKRLMRANPTYVSELAEYCKDRSHAPSAEARAKMLELELICADGSIFDEVRELVLAHVNDEICLDIDVERAAKPCCKGDGTRCRCSCHAGCPKC